MTNPFVAKTDNKNPFVDYQALAVPEENISQGLPPMTPQPGMEVPDVHGGVYANSNEFKELILKGIQDPDSLTPDEEVQFKAATENFPEIGKLVKQAEFQRKQFEETKEKERFEKQHPEEAAYKRISKYVEDYRNKKFGTDTGKILGASVPIVKTGADVVATTFKPILDYAQEAKSQIPTGISPYRDLSKDPLTPEEQRALQLYNKMNPAEKALSWGEKISWGGLEGGVSFITQTLDQIVNAERYGSTTEKAIENTANGLIDMIQEAPDQVGYIAETIFGTRSNFISGLADGIGAILNAPDLILTDKTREEIRKEAINHLYKNPESLPFAVMMVKGAYNMAARGLKEGKAEAAAQYKTDLAKTTEFNKRIKEIVSKEVEATEGKRVVEMELPNAIKEMKAGEQLDALLELGLEMKEIVRMDKGQREYILSGGKLKPETGKGFKAIDQKPAEVEGTLSPDVVNEKFVNRVKKEANVLLNDLQREFNKLEGKNDPKSNNQRRVIQQDMAEVRSYVKDLEDTLAEKQNLKEVKPETEVQKLEEPETEVQKLEEPETEIKPEPVKESEPVLEPIAPEELAKAEKDVTTAEKSLAADKAILEQIEQQMEEAGLKSGTKAAYDVDKMKEAIIGRIAQTEAELKMSQSRLSEAQKRPLKEPEQKPEPEAEKAENVKSEPVKVEDRITDYQPEISKLEQEIIQPEKVDTENKPADASRNLAHQKKYIMSLEKALKDPDRTEYYDTYREQLKEAKTELEVLEKEYEQVKSEITMPSEETTKEAPPPKDSKFEQKRMNVTDFEFDLERFQNRKTDIGEETYDKIMNEGFVESEYKRTSPITLWLDPNKNKYYVLSGHSRTKAFIDLQKAGIFDGNVDIQIFKGTEAEAIDWAQRSNLPGQLNTLAETVELYRREVVKGTENSKLEGLFGRKNISDLDAMMHLDPNGKFMKTKSETGLSEHPHISRWTKNVGDLRREYPELTNRHEQQIFDQLYPADKATGLYDKLTKDELFNIVEKQVGDQFWKSDDPIKLKKDHRPMSGARAQKNTREIQRQIDALIDEANALDNKIKSTKPEHKAYTKTSDGAKVSELRSQADELKKGVEDINERQGSMFALSGAPSPEQIAQLARTVYSGLEGVADYIKTTIESAKLPPEVKAKKADAIETMINHHKRNLDAQLQKQMAEQGVRDAIPDEGRWLTLSHAIEQGPQSKWWSQLSAKEKGVATWIREAAMEIEKFAIENGILEKPVNRAPGQVHLFHHWKNPKTGKPLPETFGKFSKTGPSLMKRTYMTLEEGIANGLIPATTNPGRLLGISMENVMRSYASREMFKALHNTAYDGLTMVIENGMERPLMMIENWKFLEKEGLTEGYVYSSDPFLSKDIYYRDKNGVKRSIKGRIGIREEIYPWWENYRATRNINALEKILMASKSMVLAGVFHMTSLSLQQAATGRFPYTGIKRGLDLLKRPDEIMQGLIRNGLDKHGFKDFEIDPIELLEFTGDKHPTSAKIGNIILYPTRAFSALTFHVVHPGMKATFAYDTFNKLWPDYQRRGLSKEVAYRDVVKMADGLFSGKDYQLALLESNRAALEAWNSVGANRFWRNILLSPTWQESHIVTAYRVGKSIVPDFAKKNPSTPIAKAYRKYLFGVLSLYSAANVYNYITTKQMDGKGRLMWDNPEGKEWFYVRAPWNNPDGTTAWIHPFKSFTEVPEMMYAMYKGDMTKYVNKLAPVVSETIKMSYNLDEFGRSRDVDVPMTERLLQYADGVTVPISITQFYQTYKYHKAPIGAVLSTAGFPVSKGYPGGESGKLIDEYKIKTYSAKADAKRAARDLVIKGKISEAVFTMAEAGYGDVAIANVLNDNRLQVKFENLSDLEKAIWLMSLTEEQRHEFIKQLSSGGK